MEFTRGLTTMRALFTCSLYLELKKEHGDHDMEHCHQLRKTARHSSFCQPVYRMLVTTTTQLDAYNTPIMIYRSETND